MPDLAASVLARLKNESVKTGRSNHLCLQLFCQEELLRRLQHSRHASALTLKGGLLLYSLSGFTGRPTMDIDFLARGISATPQKLKVVIAEIIATTPSEAFVSFTISSTKPISATKGYPGVSVSIIAQIKNVRVPFKVDVAFDDAIFDRAEKLSMPIQLDGFSAPVVRTYPLESVISEKLDAALSLLSFTSRMKDFYDLWFLRSRFDFDGERLRGALSATFERRKRTFDNAAWKAFASLADVGSMSRKWDAFTEKSGLHAPGFTETMLAIVGFLQAPFDAAIATQPFVFRWSTEAQEWLLLPNE